MVKTRKKMVMMFAVLVLCFMCGLQVCAQTKYGKINGLSYQAYSNAYKTSGNAGTACGDGRFYGKVNATYSYVNTSSLKTGSTSKSASSRGAATVGFTAPAGCRSVKVYATHYASSTNGADSANHYTSSTY